MPKKQEPLDIQKFLDYNMQQQDMIAFKNQLDSMDGRELYELETISLYNKYLVDRPVNYAFHRVMVNYPVSPIDIMRDCLIDGQVILRVADAEHIRIEQYVSRVEWDAFDNTLNFIEIKYVYQDGGRDYYHVEHYIKNPDNTATWTVYKPLRGNGTSEELVVDYTIELPLFPFVGIQWVFNTSFLMPPKAALIRLELAAQVIGAENVDRMGLALYLEGIRNVEDIKSAPRKMGRRVHILPKDAKFHSPGSDAPGMELMVIEYNNLISAIEKATGVVSTENLASLSGVSRMIAENPLIILAEELRNRFTNGMVEVVELASLMGGAEELKISYRPLKHIENKTEYLNILDRAIEKEAITDEEHITELRLLLDLSPEKP